VYKSSVEEAEEELGRATPGTHADEARQVRSALKSLTSALVTHNHTSTQAQEERSRATGEAAQRKLLREAAQRN